MPHSCPTRIASEVHRRTRSSNGVVVVLATARHRVRRTTSKDPFYRLEPGGRFSPPLWLRLHPAEPPVSRHGHVGRT